MSGDNTRTNDNTQQQRSPEQQSTDAAMSKVVQDLNAPGSKIDKSNSDLTALNDSLHKNNILPNTEITGMQANNDKLPSGQHTEAVQLNENGQQRNATYNPESHQLTYQQQGSIDGKPDGKQVQQNVTIDMLTGEKTIVGPASDNGRTTKTTTIPHEGSLASTSVITEGGPEQQPPGRVRSTESVDSNGDKTTRNFDYDHETGAVKGFTSNKDDVKGEVPADAKDAKVDPKTGDLTFTRADGVQVDYRPDGSQTQTTPADADGKQTTVTIDGKEVKVATSVNGNVTSEFPHTDVNPGSVRLDANGTVTMDRVVPTGAGGIDGSLEQKGAVRVDGQDYWKTGTVKIEPNGQETTILAGGEGSKGDGTHNGDITVVRNHSGGDVTSFTQNVDGKQVSLLGSDGKPLPGLSTDGDTLHNHTPDVHVDAATGKVKDYSTADGVKVTLDGDGKPQSYNANGFTFEHHNDGWYYHQDGEGNDFVKIHEPRVDGDGTIHTTESGGWNDGREHSLNGGGQHTGGTIFSAAIGNFGHSIVDGTINTVLTPINVVGDLTGNEDLANLQSNLIHPVDADNASRAEIIGGGIGSLAGLINPFGDVEKGESLGGKAIRIGKNAADGEKGKAKDNAKNDIQNGEADPSRWQWWYDVLTQ